MNGKAVGLLTQAEINATGGICLFPVLFDLLGACHWSQPDLDGLPASKLKVRRNAIRCG